MAVDNVSNAHEQGEPEDESYYDFGSQGEDLDSGGGMRNEDSEAKWLKGMATSRMDSVFRLEYGENQFFPRARDVLRLVIYLYPSTQQESYEVELNRCLAVRIGSRKLFQHHIPQSLWLFSTGGIRLNVYSMAQKLSWIYTDWMTGDHAWEMQSVLPHGATLLGTILSSDKTCITALSGDRVAHPLLISLANIHMATRLKSSSNAFLLTALLPVTKFVHKNKRMKGIYIADTPEAMMLACVSGKMSPITMAMYKQFGDAFQHKPWTRSKTLEQLEIVHSRAHPDDLEEFFCEAQKFRLNGVDKPFWWDWLLAEPSCGRVRGRFPIFDHTAHYWLSALLLKYLKTQAVSADAAPPGVIVAVHALMHFNYLVQSLCIDDKDLGHIAAALDEFHANKQSIIAAGVHQGKGGKTIDNWQIPKLELMQSIVTSIRNSGVIAQWSADVTEHAHVTEVKDPALLDCCDDPGVVGEESAEEDDELDDDANGFPAELLSSSRSPGQPCPITDYFSIVKILQAKKVGSVPFPLHSFVVGHTALNLAYDPSIKHATVNEIAIMFSLPDLRPAITNFLHCKATYGNHIHSIGGPRRAAHGAELPFDQVQVVMIRSLFRPALVIPGLPAAFQGTPLHKSGSSFGLLAEAGHDGLGTINT
ncbi:hypothetical protein EDB19DRAFT_1839292 [Suillus lakei]|nr:hypothetical protein EDB19DRAFT_1839292 [Suillus lakei]